MRNILIIGAGRSATSLIRYLLQHAGDEQWSVTVGDLSENLAREKCGNDPNARPIQFNIGDKVQREKEIGDASLVVSMLPASLHGEVAIDCVRLKKHMVTASYVFPEMQRLHNDAVKAGIVLLNETGLDPGIDHASSMKIIDGIRENGGEVISFKSYCGGLIAPESNDNPWGYKFTWNPRNVVLAGQGTAQYIENGKYRYLPYHRLFLQTETINVDGQGSFEAYANRDSLSYRKHYGLENIPTMLRGTLRMPGFCRAWNAFVQLGWTDDSYPVNETGNMTWKELLSGCLPGGKQDAEAKLGQLLGESFNPDVMHKLKWLGIFEDKKLPVKNASPARQLQVLLEEKWNLKEQDRDMVVMQHAFEFRKDGENFSVVSSLVVKGEDPVNTAMAKTVGLPAAISAKLILGGKIKTTGVQIPVDKEIYIPLLGELEKNGIVFKEVRSQMPGARSKNTGGGELFFFQAPVMAFILSNRMIVNVI